jgi:hypothetical protein
MHVHPRPVGYGSIVRVLGVSCLFKTTVASPIRGWAERSVTALLCPASAVMEGSGVCAY